ncbi:hypothetical protein Nmel_011351, partial [Mimus melanotis]
CPRTGRRGRSWRCTSTSTCCTSAPRSLRRPSCPRSGGRRTSHWASPPASCTPGGALSIPTPDGQVRAVRSWDDAQLDPAEVPSQPRGVGSRSPALTWVPDP